MIHVSDFRLPEQLDELNRYLNENADDIAPDSLKIFSDHVTVFIATMTDQERALDSLRASVNQLKQGLVTLDVAELKHRRNALQGQKGSENKVSEVAGSRKAVLEEIAMHEQVLASVEDGSWLEQRRMTVADVVPASS